MQAILGQFKPHEAVTSPCRNLRFLVENFEASTTIRENISESNKESMVELPTSVEFFELLLQC